MKILVLPGDGIGPEITAATLAVLDRANAKFKLGLEWQTEEIGLNALKKRGSTLPDDVMEAARKAIPQGSDAQQAGIGKCIYGRES